MHRAGGDHRKKHLKGTDTASPACDGDNFILLGKRVGGQGFPQPGMRTILRAN